MELKFSADIFEGYGTGSWPEVAEKRPFSGYFRGNGYQYWSNHKIIIIISTGSYFLTTEIGNEPEVSEKSWFQVYWWIFEVENQTYDTFGDFQSNEDIFFDFKDRK